MQILLLALALCSFSLWAHDAIVYGGPGACEEGCVDAAVEATRLAGFDPLIVTPETYRRSHLETAKVWVQPGGKSGQASNAMGAAMREDIRNYVRDGGGYVGFCAGAFLATAKVGTSRVNGLGIVPGRTILYRLSPSHISVQPTMIGNKKHHLYWEGGPRFSFTSEELKKVTVNSRYMVGDQIGGIDTTYGKGRVSIIGLHPEAPQWWFEDGHVNDPDGLDHQIAARMIKWAAK